MALKSLLCPYSGESTNSSGLLYAISLAIHHQAWLTGVAIHGMPFLEKRFAPMVSDEVLSALRQEEQAHLQALRDKFTELVGDANLDERSEFLSLDLSQDSALALMARSHDLVVMGKRAASITEEHLSATPDSVALKSGRPIVIVPDGAHGERGQLTDHALLAWDGRRSAARAIGDALHVLQGTARVTVLTVGGSYPAGSSNPDGILSLLRRHGLQAETLHRRREGKSVARIVLDTSQELGAQLLVMGAFEHSKFSHDVFGGVTTEVMAETPLPVFMSH